MIDGHSSHFDADGERADHGGAERRTEERFSRLEAATAIQRKPPRSFDCILRDISEHGCRLVGVGIDAIHAPFVLALGPRHRLCDVVWRSKKMVGVRFVAVRPADAPPASTGSLRRFRAP